MANICPDKRCPFCLVRLRGRTNRQGLFGRCDPCGARRMFDVYSSCCDAAVWQKAGIRLCAECRERPNRT